jgi:hypothetical protein
MVKIPTMTLTGMFLWAYAENVITKYKLVAEILQLKEIGKQQINLE